VCLSSHHGSRRRFDTGGRSFGTDTPLPDARRQDTNVVVAALVARGVCSDLLEHCVCHHVVVSSRPLLDELRDVLPRKFRQRTVDVRAAVRLFEETFSLVTPDALESPVCRDRDDDVVLATALAGECAAIISGDQHLLVQDPFCATRVLAPAAFWKWEVRPAMMRCARGPSHPDRWSSRGSVTIVSPADESHETRDRVSLNWSRRMEAPGSP